MSVSVFVDTNVLVYARDTTEPHKQQGAIQWMEALWQHRMGRTSAQVLSEYYVTVTRKLTPGLSPADAQRDVRALRAWKPVAISVELIAAAFVAQETYRLSYWDSLIVAAAQATRCLCLLTEDLQTGQKLGALSVVSPFETSFDEWRRSF